MEAPSTRNASVKAMNDYTLAVLRREDLKFVLDTYPLRLLLSMKFQKRWNKDRRMNNKKGY